MRTDGYHGVRSPSPGQRQSAPSFSKSHVGRPSVPARWAISVSTVTTSAAPATRAAVRCMSIGQPSGFRTGSAVGAATSENAGARHSGAISRSGMDRDGSQSPPCQHSPTAPGGRSAARTASGSGGAAAGSTRRAKGSSMISMSQSCGGRGRATSKGTSRSIPGWPSNSGRSRGCISTVTWAALARRCGRKRANCTVSP